MRIGICAYWFNRGQGVVARQLRSALDELGHDTFVLARPTRAANIKPSFIDHSGVWDQPRRDRRLGLPDPGRGAGRVGRASTSSTSRSSTRTTSSRRSRRCATSGVRTAGRFVWEQFATEHVEPAKRALDAIYSLTACEQERYATMGIESPRVRWGIHPELLGYARPASGTGDDTAEAAGVRFFYPAGFLSKRKPVAEVLKAFRRYRDDRARLVVKGQVERQLDARSAVRRRATRGSRWCSRTCRPTSTCGCSPPPTSASPRAAGRGSACICTSRWRSACR